MGASRVLALTGLALTAGILSACAATQVREDTLEMVSDVSHIRQTQVLQNIAAAISDHDMVPSEILLGAGQATVASQLAPSIKLPHLDLSKPTKELDAGWTDTWTAQWQVAPVTNSDDLRRLRDLYVLIASTDEQYNMLEAYFRRHPEQKAPIECYGKDLTASQAAGAAAPDEAAADRFLRSDLPVESQAVAGQGQVCPPGYGPGQIPKWRKAVDVLENGDSIDCRIYQESDPARVNGVSPKGRTGLPFRRWLYWKSPGGSWQPQAPETAPKFVGLYGGWELGITSKACLNDFVILVQAATPTAEEATQNGPKLMLNTQ